MAKAAKRKVSALEKLARRLHEKANQASADNVLAGEQCAYKMASRYAGREEAYRSAANSVLRLVRKGGRGER